MVSFMTVITSTSGRLNSEVDRLLFFQVHLETDHFFVSSRVQLPQTQYVMFHFLRTVFSDQVKVKVGNILTNKASYRSTSGLWVRPVIRYRSFTGTDRITTSPTRAGTCGPLHRLEPVPVRSFTGTGSPVGRFNK